MSSGLRHIDSQLLCQEGVAPTPWQVETMEMELYAYRRRWGRHVAERQHWEPVNSPHMPGCFVFQIVRDYQP